MTLPTTMTTTTNTSSSTALVPTAITIAKQQLPHLTALDASKQMQQKSRVWQFFGHKLAELKHVARTKNRKKLFEAVTRGSLPDVMEQLALGADVNIKLPSGETPLHIAASRGHHKIMVLLLDRGAEVNVATNEGMTPLFMACEKNREHAVKILLAEKARVDLPALNVTGFQAIHVAAKNGFTEVVKMLLKHGAKVDTITKPKLLTPLMLASRAGASDVVELLLDCGADPDLEDREGNTPLHFASSEGHYRPTYLLLTAGADPEMPNGHEETPFDVANRNGFSHITYLLETNGMGAGSGPHQHSVQQVDHAFANDPQLLASIARNRPELAEVIVKHRVKYAALCLLGCVYEEEDLLMAKYDDDDDHAWEEDDDTTTTTTDNDSDCGVPL